MAVIAHPQQLTALFAMLFQRGQRHRVRRFGTRGSGSSHHGRSPAELFILLLSFRLHLLSRSLFRPGEKAEWQTSREKYSSQSREIGEGIFAAAELLSARVLTLVHLHAQFVPALVLA